MRATCKDGYHVVHRAPCGTFEYCECNEIRTAKVEPMSYSETVDYVTDKLKEGLYRGENCASLLKVAVVEAIPLDPAFDAYIDKSWNESIDFYKNQWPNFHVCAKCRTVAQKDAMVCTDCASGKKPWLDNLHA